VGLGVRERLPGGAHCFVGWVGGSGPLDKKGFQNLIKYFVFNAEFKIN
jgi:hypothetical protein